MELRSAQLKFGSPPDVTLYRSAAAVLTVGGHLVASGQIGSMEAGVGQIRLSTNTGAATGLPTIFFRSDLATSLYSDQAGGLTTNSRLAVAHDSGIYTMGSNISQYAYRSYVTGDGSPRLLINAQGDMAWGPGNAVGDISIGRAYAGTLGINGDVVNVGFIQAGTRRTIGGWALSIAAQGDAGSRMVITNDGNLNWGPVGSTDTVLSRYSAGVLAINGSPLAPLPARLGAPSVQVTDLNNAIENGWYWFDPSAANKPFADYGSMHVVNLNTTGNTRQMIYAYSSDVVWMRRRTDATTWHPWVQVYGAPASVGGMTLIMEDTLGGNGWFQTGTLPQIYRHLRVEIIARSSHTGTFDYLAMRANGVASGYWNKGDVNNSGSTDRAYVGIIAGNDWWDVAWGESGTVIFEIPYYSFNGWKKTIHSTYSSRVDAAGTAGDIGAGKQYALINDITGPITSLALFTNSGGSNAVLAGSKMSVYGIG